MQLIKFPQEYEGFSTRWDKFNDETIKIQACSDNKSISAIQTIERNILNINLAEFLPAASTPFNTENILKNKH